MLGRNTAGRAEPPPQAAPPAVTPAVPEPALPQLPAVQPPLGRGELIAAAASAADAFAAEQALPESVVQLAGREFDVRLPFGCPGASDAQQVPLSWRYDREREVLRLRAEPVRWAPDEWLAADGAPPIETIEGFWVARPWTSSETCPARASGTLPASSASNETLGLAQFLSADGSRVGRRDGKAFQAVEKVAAEALDASRGFRLRLRGHVVAGPGAPILCRAPEGPDIRPACLITVTLDEVAFENPANGSTIATWDVARPDARGPGSARSGAPR